jgi:hypothetical protein
MIALGVEGAFGFLFMQIVVWSACGAAAEP